MNVVILLKMDEHERVLVMGRLLKEVEVEQVMIASEGMSPSDIMSLANDGKMSPDEIMKFLGDHSYREVSTHHPVLRLQALASAVALLMKQNAEDYESGTETETPRDQLDT